MLLLLAALLLGAAHPVHPGVAAEALRSYLACALAFLLLTGAQPRRTVRAVLLAGALALLLIAPLAFAPAVEENRKILAFNSWVFSLGSQLPVRFFRAPHPNGLAVGLAVTLPLLLAAGLEARSRGELFAWSGLTAGALLFVGLSASRTAWLGTLLGVGLLVGLQNGPALRRVSLIFAGVMGLALLLGAPSQQDLRWLTSTWSLMERREQWANTLEMLATEPLLGVGLGSFPFLYPATMGAGDLRPHETPNNAYLQLYADGGLPALMAMAWLGSRLLRLISSLRPAGGGWGRWSAGLAGSLLVLGWSGLLETSTVLAFVWPTAGGGYHYLASPLPWLLCALATQLGRLEGRGRDRPYSSSDSGWELGKRRMAPTCPSSPRPLDFRASLSRKCTRASCWKASSTASATTSRRGSRRPPQ